MSDSQRGLRFGLSLPPTAADGGEIRELVHVVDKEGLDLLGIQDHPYAPQFLDTMSLIAVLLAETERLTIFPNVASLPLRPPAVLAKAAASLDILSGGRFELGLGSGAVWPAIQAMGGPQRSTDEAIRSLEDAIAVIRSIWSGKRGVRHEGKHYSLGGVHAGPPPAHPIGIWVGSVGPRMLRLAGRLGDGWAAPIPAYLPYEEWGRAQSLIDAGAREAGRDPAEVVRIANIPGTITSSSGDDLPRGSAPLRGSDQFWAEMLAGWALELRFDGFVFWPEAPSREQIERFTHEVAPAVRGTVKRERESV